MRYILCFVFLLFISVKSGSSQCRDYDFPCEDGECIGAELWCDSSVDCADGSDEKYCKKAGVFKKNPNKCPSTYFRCSDGPCIPMAGRCDGYDNCRDSSDEHDCPHVVSTFKSSSTSQASEPVISPLETRTTAATTPKTTTRPTTHQTPVNDETTIPTYLSDSFESQHFVEVVYSNVHSSDYSHQREKARDWLISQRRSDFGWGDETPRAITALYLSELGRSTKNESNMLMVKQLEVQLSLDMARNATKNMKLTDLALYINALLASCKDPKNFYGEDLVRILRNGVDAAQKDGKFVNPSAFLTLCINNASTYEDTKKIHDIFSSRNAALGRTDIQALALLVSTCINRNTNYLSASVYEGIQRQFLHKVNVSGFPGNVYEASLIYQALQELKKSLPGLLEFILRQQQEDGSFGDILATYLVLPVLSGRTFLHMNDHCGQKYTTDPAPIEVLNNVKRRKIHVQYSLNYGNPTEITQTIQMQVAEGISFLDVMRLAQEINPKYRFMLDDNREIPVVYSIGGITNDAEKGMFWTLHLASNSNTVASDTGRLSPYTGNIKQLMPHNGDEFVFWMRSI